MVKEVATDEKTGGKRETRKRKRKRRR